MKLPPGKDRCGLGGGWKHCWSGSASRVEEGAGLSHVDLPTRASRGGVFNSGEPWKLEIKGVGAGGSA